MNYDMEPKAYVEAMQSQGWQETTTLEVDFMNKNQTWEEVDFLDGQCIITAIEYLKE